MSHHRSQPSRAVSPVFRIQHDGFSSEATELRGHLRQSYLRRSHQPSENGGRGLYSRLTENSCVAENFFASSNFFVRYFFFCVEVVPLAHMQCQNRHLTSSKIDIDQFQSVCLRRKFHFMICDLSDISRPPLTQRVFVWLRFDRIAVRLPKIYNDKTDKTSLQLVTLWPVR